MSEEQTCFDCHFLIDKSFTTIESLTTDEVLEKKEVKFPLDWTARNRFKNPEIKKIEQLDFNGGCYHGCWVKGDKDIKDLKECVVEMPRYDCFYFDYKQHMRLEGAVRLEDRKTKLEHAEADRKIMRRHLLITLGLLIFAALASIYPVVKDLFGGDLPDLFSNYGLYIAGILLLIAVYILGFLVGSPNSNNSK
jgi:hypothetical protein